jgi:hypothetical protein
MFKDYIFHTTQVSHEKLGLYDFKQSKPGLNSFLYTPKNSEVTVGILTKSHLNIITLNKDITDLPAHTVKRKAPPPANICLPDDDLFSVTLLQKPSDYISQVDCVKSDIVSNAFINPGKDNVDYIVSHNNTCFVFRFPTALIAPK